MSDRHGTDLNTTSTAAHDACGDDCGHDDGRRTFLRDGLMAVAALTAIAGGAAPLHAMARDYATGLAALGTVTYPVPAADGATIDRANRLILVRYQGMVHAFSLECPHRGTMVQWEPQNARFYCPKHKSTFRPEGTRIQGKAPRSLDRYAVKVEAGKVVVDTSVAIDAEQEAARWAAAGVKVG
jgi:nitrite reductase/ring-hydroxylating ferredoxin subunit